MRANFGSFFDDDHRNLFTICCSQLRQAAGGSEAGRSATDDDHIEFHRFPFCVLGHIYFFLSGP